MMDHAHVAPAGESLVSAMDYREHEKTYVRFMHLAKWFVYHISLLVVSLYCFIIANQPLLGAGFLLAAVVVLGVGLATTARAPQTETVHP